MCFLLLIPFFLVRFGLLAWLSPQALARAAFFPPTFRQQHPAAFWLYQLSSGGIFLYPLWLKLPLSPPWLYVGGICYLIGLVLLVLSILQFAAPSPSGINQTGLYRLSRNPMYLAYFLLFTGCALLAQSWVLFCLVLCFQGASHLLILAEEDWCLEQFGQQYRHYMQKVRRYL